ncbi:MAG: hypothetical protein ACYDDU_21970 [Dermatophilaceae bacterium]
MISDSTNAPTTRDPSLAPSVLSDVVGAQPAPRLPRPLRVRRRVVVVALALVLALLAPGVSYAQALTYPGSATWQMRSVEWLRDHGGSPLVDRIENWYYTANRPTGSAPAAAILPVIAAGHAGAGRTLPPPPALAGHSPVLGKGTWVPGRLDPSGSPAIYTSFFRPDPQYPSVVAGVAWIRARSTIAHLVAGTREPGGHRWPGGAQVAQGDVPRLVATFNSGWKMTDTGGGFYLAGQSTGHLRDGQASLVIDDSGAATIGQWARDVAMNRHVVAVRQNLALIVDHRRPVAGLAANTGQRWGSYENQHQYTWRSGVGVDTAGDLIYVAGANLTLQTLAVALADAGVVRAMELDIHSALVSFASWAPSLTRRVVPTRLLPGMERPADRYLAADQRDFFYLTLR